jgi:heme/copper-type cytochrome/quinol oxidase subunit 2
MTSLCKRLMTLILILFFSVMVFYYIFTLLISIARKGKKQEKSKRMIEYFLTSFTSILTLTFLDSVI